MNEPTRTWTLGLALRLGLARAARARRLAVYGATLSTAIVLAAYLRWHPELMPRIPTEPSGSGEPVLGVAIEVFVFGSIVGRFLVPFAIVGLSLALAVDTFASDPELGMQSLVAARAVPRWAYYLGRRVACDAVLLGLVSATVCLVFLILCPDRTASLGPALGVAALAVAAYGAAFGLIAQTPRAALAAGLVFGFVWELALGEINEHVRVLVVSYYLRTVLIRTVTHENLAFYRTFASVPQAVAWLVAFIVIANALGAVVFDRRGHDLRRSSG